jgi:hypothetical protein
MWLIAHEDFIEDVISAFKGSGCSYLVVYFSVFPVKHIHPSAF